MRCAACACRTDILRKLRYLLLSDILRMLRVLLLLPPLESLAVRRPS
jgi:hypothetical protein